MMSSRRDRSLNFTYSLMDLLISAAGVQYDNRQFVRDMWFDGSCILLSSTFQSNLLTLSNRSMPSSLHEAGHFCSEATQRHKLEHLRVCVIAFRYGFRRGAH